MPKVIFFLAFLVFAIATFGQSNVEKFQKYFKAKDTTKLKQLMASWEKTGANDPDFYATSTSYYFYLSQQETMAIENESMGKEGLQITDSTGKAVGDFTSSINFNPKLVKKALSYVDKGIAKFPDRLDMRFGKCYILGSIEDYDNFTKVILNTIEYSKINKCNWLWTENKKNEFSEKMMLESIQAYLKQLYDTENDDLLTNMKQIGDLTIKYYPNNIEILTTTSIAYLLTKDYDKAIVYLKQAEKLNPEDFIVLNNIVQAYRGKGDKANTLKYCKLVKKYGDASAIALANKVIEEMEEEK